jgi:hypothetical protein
VLLRQFVATFFQQFVGNFWQCFSRFLAIFWQFFQQYFAKFSAIKKIIPSVPDSNLLAPDVKDLSRTASGSIKAVFSTKNTCNRLIANHFLKQKKI